MTKKRDVAVDCLLLKRPTSHIQQERYGQQDNAPAHRMRETVELL